MTVKQRHETAYRMRMGIVGALQSCICTWPLERELTSTQHSQACPAHRMIVADASRDPS